MAKAARPTVFTISAGAAFADSLAQGIVARHGDDPMAMNRVKIFLPTQRACRGLREAFLRVTDGRPMLLPAIQPLGDIDEAAEVFTADWLGGEAALIAPAMPELRRLFLLMRLILAKPETNNDPAVAAALAQELAVLMDGVITEGLSWDALESVAPADLAAHWQRTVDFLDILRRRWPEILADNGAIEPAARRIRMLEMLADRWRSHPPTDPVYAAGSTGSIPATAALLKAIAYAPSGAVVLPGLDTALDAESFAHASQDPCHPQYGLARLLAALEMDRREVDPWLAGASSAPNPARSEMLREALRPAATTDHWRDGIIPDVGAFRDLTRLECNTSHDEAMGVAILLREALEIPGQTAALVTPDRGLARRVAVELKRWGIEVDDSAGVPLAQTPPGNFLRLTARMVEEGFSPIAFLAALKHPLAQAGQARGAFLARLREVEIKLLRGPRLAPGIAGLAQAAKASAHADDARDRLDPETLSWLEGLLQLARPFAELMQGSAVTLDRLLAAHLAFAEALARSPAGDLALWQGDAGEALAVFAGDTMAAASDLGPIEPAHWPALLDRLLQGQTVRPKFGRHPRLFIWGLLEARLQQADLTILGGLNEGVWPAEPPEDPWFSRPMREKFGLAPLDRRIGQTAHDFVQAASAPRVVLSRARKIEGAPAQPARWWLRLDAMLAGNPAWAATRRNDASLWAGALDRPEQSIVLAPPAPRPPVAARPRRLGFTRVETLIRDPYAIFARYVLKLYPLDALDAPADARDRGNLIHAILEKFAAAYPDQLPTDALQRLIDLAHGEFAKLAQQPAVKAIWWPRFLRVAEWFVGFERLRRQAGIRVAMTEAGGHLEFDSPGGRFRLEGRADRIDRLADGSLAILDYKTGQLPTPAQVTSGLSPQLPLEAVMASQGGFQGLAKARVAEMAYVRLSGGNVAGEYKVVAPAKVKGGEANDPEALAEKSWAGLRRLVAHYDRLETPYLSRPRAQFQHRQAGDYDHLARVAEWLLVQENGDD